MTGRRRVLWTVLFCVVGVLLGYGYFRVIGCQGACPIAASPYRSMLYGGVIGLLLSVAALPSDRKES